LQVAQAAQLRRRSTAELRAQRIFARSAAEARPQRGPLGTLLDRRVAAVARIVGVRLRVGPSAAAVAAPRTRVAERGVGAGSHGRCITLRLARRVALLAVDAGRGDERQ
jgi:hypothetical protein